MQTRQLSASSTLPRHDSLVEEGAKFEPSVPLVPVTPTAPAARSAPRAASTSADHGFRAGGRHADGVAASYRSGSSGQSPRISRAR